MNGYFLNQDWKSYENFGFALLDVIITATCLVTVYRAAEGDWLVNLKDVGLSTETLSLL